MIESACGLSHIGKRWANCSGFRNGNGQFFLAAGYSGSTKREPSAISKAWRQSGKSRARLQPKTKPDMADEPHYYVADDTVADEQIRLAKRHHKWRPIIQLPNKPAAIDDPSPSSPHKAVMQRMFAKIAVLQREAG